MANKKVKISECCIISTDDKGQRTLVGKAKEALTTLAKNKVYVTIALETTPKDAAEKFLNENNVPYHALSGLPAEEKNEEKKFDAVILGENNVILYRGDWQWTLNSLVDALYGDNDAPIHESEQKKMDDKWNEYKRWADELNKARAKRVTTGPHA